MIRLTKQADYGIVLLSRIAGGDPDSLHAARDLSGETGLPLPMVSKILKALAKGGLLTSHRGVKGGYSLSRPASRISMADVIAALEGPIAMTECMSGPASDCEHQPSCRVQHAWRRINGAVLHALDSVSLAEMAGSEPAPLVTIDTGKPLGAQAG